MAHVEAPPQKSGSIPASSLHYWFKETIEAQILVEKFHYSHRWPSNVQLIVTAHTDGGLFGNKGDAVAAVVYSVPGTRWSLPVWELSRLVRRDDVQLPLSALVAASVRKLRRMNSPCILVSFADWTHKHHGGVYQACGWNYHGLRDQRMDGIVINSTFIPGRNANHLYGTQSPSKLLSKGIVAQPHYDEGKHLYWLAWGKGVDTSRLLGLEKCMYPKPNR